ncbi:MAG: hypothetical protein WCI73_04095, partial [Phycisphaerae bacterium]
TALSRYIIQRTPYAAFSPTFESAHLSLWGNLMLRNVEIREAGPRSDAVLLTAGEIQVDFSWWGLLQRRLQSVTAHDLTLYVRPGQTHALTLQTLATWPPTMDGLDLPAPPAAPPPSGNPWWIGQVAADGWLHTESLANATVLMDTLSFRIHVAMQGARHLPEESVDLKIGAAAMAPSAEGATRPADTTPSSYPVFPGFRHPQPRATPSLATTLHFIPTPTGQRRIVIDSLEARDLGLLWNAHDLLARLPETFPPQYRLASDELLLDLGQLSFRGTLEPAAPTASSHFQGQGEITALTTRPRSAIAGTRPLITQLGGQFNFDLPLAAPAAARRGVAAVQMHWDALDLPDATTSTAPGVHLGAGTVAGTLSEHKLTTDNLTLQTCDGTIHGTGQMNLDNPTDLTGKLTLTHLDIQQALAALPLTASQKNDLSGHLSADLTLQRQPGGPIQADITLPAAQFTATFESLRGLLPQLPADLQGPAELQWSGITFSLTDNTGPSGHPNYAANINLNGLTVRTTDPASFPLLLDTLNLKLGGRWQPAQSPAETLAKHDFTALTLDPSTLTATALTLGKIRVDNLKLNVTVQTGLLSASDLAGNAYGGTIAGTAQVNLSNPSDAAGKLTIKNLDQQQLRAALPLSEPLQSCDLAGLLSADLTFQHQPGQPTQAQITLPPAQFTATFESLRGLLPHLSENLKGPVTLQWSGITLSVTDHTASAGQAAYAANVNLNGLTFRTGDRALNPCLLDSLNLKLGGSWHPVLPPAAALAALNFTGLTLEQGTLSTTALALGKLRVDNLKLNLGTNAGLLSASDLAFNAYGGVFAGSARVNLANPTDVAGKFTIKKLDQHQLLAAFAPEKVDASGTVSGSARLAMTTDAGLLILLPRRAAQIGSQPAPHPTTSPAKTQLSNLLVTADLTADGPGRLFIKDEQLARQIAGSLPTGGVEAAGILPDNYSDIVVGQLKNYPYLEGTIGLTNQTGLPVFHLSYHRPSLTPGEPGYGIKKKIQDQDLLVSYPVQLSSVVITMQNQTLRELFDRLTGWQGMIAPTALPTAP